jgi:ribosomal protein S18 acetylase RimI-like enzyme
MISVHVVAVTADRMSTAQALIFEYMATTQREVGRAVPDSIDHLPGVLRSECLDLAAVYRRPGALLIAYRDDEVIGCVGVKSLTPRDAVEVKRLYVRAADRHNGVARMLMRRAHQHAAENGFQRLVLDVLRSRTRAVEFYQQLGYAELPQRTAESSVALIYMQRAVTP